MWSNVLSMDKQYDKEKCFVLEKLKSMKNMSYALEESKDRIFIYIASLCEMQEDVEKQICEIVETIYLSFLKLRFFLTNLSNLELNHANCALICSLVHFDRDFESNIVAKALSDTLDFNIDGIMNFRLGALTSNWEELCGVASRLVESGGEDSDMFEIANFITGTEGSNCQLSLSNNRLFNITNRKSVEVINLFDNAELNLISAIIKQHPSEIHVEKNDFTQPMANALRHIAKVITK